MTQSPYISVKLPRKAIVPSDFISLALILVVGLANLIYPFTGDQALFAVGGRMLNNGVVLYRDFWDLKQPGIYWFYLLAGRCFGFTEVGIHSFELAYFIGFGAAVYFAMRTISQSWITVNLAVLLSGGVYLAVCGPWHLTQAEGLVVFPLFLTLWASCSLSQHCTINRSQFWLFGFAAVAVMLFKLILVVLPIAFIANTIAFQLFTVRRSISEVAFRVLIPSVLSVAIALSPVIIYFGLEHQLGLLYKTFITYPHRIVAEVQLNGFHVLASALKWFLLASFPLLPFAAIGAKRRLSRSWDLLTSGLVLWIIGGLAVILAQRMWWAYHFVLLLAPLGILAALGVEEVEGWLAEVKPTIRATPIVIRTALLLVLVGPYAWRWSRKVGFEVQHGLPVTIAQQMAFRKHISSTYSGAAEALASYNQDLAPNGIYVLGDPLIYFLSNQKQAVALNGWSPEWFLPEQWSELARELEDNPPNLIFVAKVNEKMLNEKGQEFTAFVAQHYRRTQNTGDGHWYVLNPIGG